MEATEHLKKIISDLFEAKKFFDNKEVEAQEAIDNYDEDSEESIDDLETNHEILEEIASDLDETILKIKEVFELED